MLCFEFERGFISDLEGLDFFGLGGLRAQCGSRGVEIAAVVMHEWGVVSLVLLIIHDASLLWLLLVLEEGTGAHYMWVGSG